MNTRGYLTCFLTVALALAAQAQGRSTISKPADRQATLKAAETLLADKTLPAGDAAEELKNPFSPPARDLREDVDPDAKNKKTPERKQYSDADLLQALAKQIQPTGSGVAPGSGEPFLYFGEKRQKIGDKLIVVLEGVEYAVEIISVDANRFRLRYNNEEFSRPIK